MTIHKFLVTAHKRRLGIFHLNVATFMNAIYRQKDTILYTCMGPDRASAIHCAQQAHVTLQEIERHQHHNQSYTTLVDNGPGWHPESCLPSPDSLKS